jgi:uncharacterized membrane protein YvbJ
MFCQKCGKENIEDALFCNSCGIPFTVQKVPRKETTLTQVAEGGLAFGILGGILGVFSGFGGVIIGFITFFIGGFILCYAGASIYDIFRR